MLISVKLVDSISDTWVATHPLRYSFDEKRPKTTINTQAHFGSTRFGDEDIFCNNLVWNCGENERRILIEIFSVKQDGEQCLT